jgi:hypothetical protein
MKFVVVEDDAPQMAEICSMLEEFEGSEIVRCDSEASFAAALPSLATAPPNIAIIDIYVRAVAPGASVFYTPPNDDYREAGFRCLARLRADPVTREVPAILYSSLLPPDQWPQAHRNLSPHDYVVRKDGTLDALRLTIRSLRPDLKMVEHTFIKRLWNAASVRFGPLSVNVKSFFSRR